MYFLNKVLFVVEKKKKMAVHCYYRSLNDLQLPELLWTFKYFWVEKQLCSPLVKKMPGKLEVMMSDAAHPVYDAQFLVVLWYTNAAWLNS